MTTPTLTDDQRNTVKELQKELRDLNLQADIAWAKYMHTKDEDCYTEVMALESEIEMKGLIAYIPKAGELKIDKIRGLVGKIKGKKDDKCDGCELGDSEARIQALRSVNAFRDELELPPLDRLPKGTPGEVESCTLALALWQTAQDFGLEGINVNVSDGNDVELYGYSSDGEQKHWNPKLGTWASQLIREFDQHAWLDLLDDDALEGYADTLFDEENWSRLQEVSNEFAERGRALEAGYGNVLQLGVDTEPIEDQVAALNLEEEEAMDD